MLCNNTLNRAERRAIEHGKGRNEPFVEVVDLDTLCLYSFGVCAGTLDRDPFENKKRLFIECQIDPFDWRDECLE